MSRTPRARLILAAAGLLVIPTCRATFADEKGQPPPSPAAVAFFENKVRPVLAENCHKCHGPKKQRARLRLDSRAAILQGGDSGPALVPGQPGQSLLLKAVRHDDPDLKMPPSQKLSRQQIDDLTRWVQMGAPWPDSGKTAPIARKPGELKVTDKDRDHWAFRPVRRPPLPKVKDARWGANPIDAFVLAGLEAKGLQPNPPASRRELIRRASFDLLGLPPSPEEIDAFVADNAPDAWERLLDRLLSSPHYGERWARHWLDVVRYAQSNGYERDDEKPFAWRYRDYVIQAFNQDRPFDRFVREQLAGDELPDRTDDSLIATGFYRLGVWDDEPDDARQAAYDELDDILSTTAQAFLGLTVGCARCHDHKFDPIPQRDYYRLLAFFHNVRGYERVPPRLDSAVFAPLGPRAAVERWQAEQRRQLRELDRQVAAASDPKVKAKLRKQRDAVAGAPPPFPVALAVREKGPQPPRTQILIRGSAASPGEEVEPGFLEVLARSPPALPAPAPGAATSGRRRVLAEWVASRDNPLTARVLVNRVWLHHFGRGLVETPNDFGKTGLPPTHPELLDWLAAELVESGWSIKRLHRRIMTSRAYQLSSQAGDERALAADEANRLYWRQTLRRLEVEAIRDAVLAVSGRLNPEMGGRGVFPRLSREVVAGQSRPGLGWDLSDARQCDRRSVYLFVKRTMLVPMLETFDYTNTAQPVGERPTTTVAPQALLLLNSELMQDQAAAFAARVAREAGDDPAAQVGRAYRLALGRAPTERELRIALAYLGRQTKALAALQPPLTVAPKVPSSLSADYLRQLRPADFLSGPREGWTYHRGDWGAPYEGINKVDRRRGPFALWQPRTFADATVEARVTLHHAAELGGVLFRARPQGDVLVGYELTLDPREGRVLLRRHGAKGPETLGEVRTPVATRHEHRLKIVAVGPRLRAWLGDGERPLLDVTDRQPVLGPGHLGLRAWGSPLSAREVFVEAGGERVRVDPGRPLGTTEARRRALGSLCLAVLNLNEFVYVD
jgi:mono/diheme cytochrome c family protein